MITILSQSHTNYMATFTNFTNFTILHRHTWAWVKLGLSQLGCLKPWVRQPQLLVIPTVYLTRKWEIRATILLGCGHHHTMTNCWHLKIGFWLSRMVWALVTYYASTNGQLVVGVVGIPNHHETASNTWHKTPTEVRKPCFQWENHLHLMSVR